MRRIAGIIGLAAGVFLIAVPFSLSLFSRTGDAKPLLNQFRPVFSAQGTATLRQDFTILNAAGVQLSSTTLPTLANALHMTPVELNAFLGQHFPDVATGVSRFPTITAEFGHLVALVERDHNAFHSTDMIPVSWLPITSVPWIYLALGIGCLAAGAGCLWRPQGGAALAALFVVGAIAVGLPFGASFFSKTSAAHHLVGDLRTPLSAQGASTAQADLMVVERMGTQLTTQLLPTLATQLHMAPAQLNTFLASNSPALATAVGQFPRLIAEFSSVVNKLTNSVGDYNGVRKIPFPSLPWLLLIPGVFCLAASTAGAMRRAPATVLATPVRL